MACSVMKVLLESRASSSWTASVVDICSEMVSLLGLEASSVLIRMCVFLIPERVKSSAYKRLD